jgi:protein regulator of cytokinesis 1
VAVFRDTKDKIKKLLDELEEVPDTSFENDIMSEEEESCLLSPENMKMLKKFHDEVYKI